MTLSSYANVGIGAKLYMSSDVNNTYYASVADTATGNFTAIAEVRSFSVDADCGEAEVTAMDSGGVRQFLPTYLGATVNASLNWLPHNTTSSPALFNAYQGRDVGSFWLDIPTRKGASAQTNLRMFFLGFMTGFRVNIEGDAAQTADVTWRVADSTIDERIT